MKIKNKLRLVICILLTLFVVLGIVSYMYIIKIHKDLASIINVEVPSSAASFEMEINLEEIGVALFEYLNQHNDDSLLRIKKDEKHFEFFLNQYLKLAISTREKKLAGKINKTYILYKNLTTRLIHIEDGLRKYVGVINENFEEMDNIIDDNIQIFLKSKLPLIDEKMHVSMELEININGIAKGLAKYLISNDPRYERRIDKDEDDFNKALKEYKKLRNCPLELQYLKQLQDIFTDNISHIRNLIELSKVKDKNLIIFAKLRAEIDDFLDDEVQIISQNKLRLAENKSNQTIHTTFNVILSILIFGFIVGIFLSVIITRSITLPIKKLRKGVEIIGEGNLNYRVNVNSKDEIGLLAKAFNTMTGDLKSSRSELEFYSKNLKQLVGKRTLELESKISEYKIAQKEINRKNVELNLLSKFPSENPNPVLRVKRDKTILFLNQSAQKILQKNNFKVGTVLTGEWEKYIDDVLKSNTVINEVEISVDDRIYSYNFVPVINSQYINIYGIDINQRKQIEKNLIKKTHDLSERVKEINCLYRISKLMETSDVELKDICQAIVGIISSSWQYPDITCSRMKIDNKEYTTATFVESNWKQEADISVNDKMIGILQVYYIEERPEIAEGPFLKEERDLLDAIAVHIGKRIEKFRMNVEHAAIQNKLFHSEKMASIGEVAAGLGHEINQPLGALLLTSEVLEEAVKINDLNRVKIYSGKIKTQVKRISNLINSLNIFSRTSTQDRFEPVDLNVCINNIITLLLPQIKQDSIELELDLSADPLVIDSSRIDIERLLLNILNNSRFAVNTNIDKKIISVQTIEKDNKKTIIISDNGSGIPKNIINKIFDPFFTTKDIGKGTGLGLSLCHGIVQKYNGSISVESELTEGSVFTIIF